MFSVLDLYIVFYCKFKGSPLPLVRMRSRVTPQPHRPLQKWSRSLRKKSRLSPQPKVSPPLSVDCLDEDLLGS